MLSREDSRRLAEMERQLLNDDPEFCARMSGGGTQLPRHRRRLPISLIFTVTVIWIVALILGVLGWWPAAAVAALCGATVAAATIHRSLRGRRRSG